MNTMESDIKEAVVKAFEEIIARNEIKEFIKGELYKAINKEEPEKWITVKGNHIPIFKGQTEEEAVEKFLANKVQILNDKEKIGGVLKGKPMSFHKADSGNINPNYKKGDKYTKNCQTCTLTLNLRLQGYDITAKPYDEKNLEQVKLAHEPWIAYKDTKVFSIKAETPSECEKWLQERLKKNALYSFGYRPGFNKYKHLINVKKNILGKVEFYDPQNGEKLKTREVLKDAYTYKRNYGDNEHYPPIIFRTDNKEIDMDFVKKLFSFN